MISYIFLCITYLSPDLFFDKFNFKNKIEIEFTEFGILKFSMKF